MTSLRMLLWTLSVILLITITSVECRRPRPRRQPPPPLYLYPGPHPPSSRKRGPPRRPIQPSSYHSDLIYNDPESSSLYRGSHSKPPSLYKPYDEYVSSPYSRPSKPKKSSYIRGPPPSKKYPYYTSATSHKSSRPITGSHYSSSPYHSEYHSDHHGDYHASDFSSEQIPKETIATFVNRPSSSYKGTPTLKYNGYSNKPTISYGPPYPPKPFKSYGVPSSSASQEYVEEEYDDEEMFGSHPHSTAIKNPRNSSSFSHVSFNNGKTSVQYANEGHGSNNKYGPNKFTADRDVLVDPSPMRPIPSTPGPFQIRNRNKRPQRGDDSQHFSPSTSRPFKSNHVVRHPTPDTPKYPAVDINGPKYPTFGNNEPKYSSVDMTASYKSKSPGNGRYPEITAPTPVYPDQEALYPKVEVITGGRPQFSVHEVFPNRDTTKQSNANVDLVEEKIKHNYDQFLKETFSPKHRTQGSNDQYSEQEHEPTSSPPNHKPSRTRSADSSRQRERQRPTPNRTKSRLRAQPTRQYEVHDDPEDREDTPKTKDFEYIE